MMNSIFHAVVAFLSLGLIVFTLFLCHDDASFFCGDSPEKSFTNIGNLGDNLKLYWNNENFSKNLPK
jgi:hypothetical protein